MIRLLTFAVLFGVLFLMGCGSSGYTVYGERDPADGSFKGVVVQDGSKPMRGCRPVPQGLKDNDLVGIWIPHFSFNNTTLILREDGTFRQIYNNPITGDNYESSGHDMWWIEKRESGIWRLHLEGMKMCDHGLYSDCERYGDEARRGVWTDLCEGESISMNDKVVLLVIGHDQESILGEVPKGIRLKYLIQDPDSPTGSFQLQE